MPKFSFWKKFVLNGMFALTRSFLQLQNPLEIGANYGVGLVKELIVEKKKEWSNKSI